MVKRARRNNTNWRPQYHFTAPNSWINDPNGLIYYKGHYHMFYQYNPYGCEWGAMHWGHAISDDMIYWEDLPVALKPDRPYDNHEEGGCFSGSAVEKEGKLYLFYTAVTKENGKSKQTQCIAISDDGVTFKKYENNPVIQAPPKGASEDFRDPKVFEKNGKWYMVVGGSVGGADCGGDGRIFLYESDTLLEWQYRGEVLRSEGNLGTMFECPDMFEINGKWILTCSPMHSPNYRKTIGFLGVMDFEKCIYKIEKMVNLDVGFDYYAPQSFLDERGNRVMIAWQNGWLWMPWCEGWGPTESEGWRGVLSIPRKASLDSAGNLCLYPTSNLKKLLRPETKHNNLKLQKEKWLVPISNSKSVYFKIRIKESDVLSKIIEVGLLGKENAAIKMCIDFVGMNLSIVRGCDNDAQRGIINSDIQLMNGILELDLFVDQSCFEVYLNKGEQCITMNVYPEEVQNQYWVSVPYKEAYLDYFEAGVVDSIWEEQS